MNEKPKILFLLHLPPPVHGSSVVGNNIKNSAFINGMFDCKYINLLASKQVSESGKLSFRKIFEFFITIKKVFTSIIDDKPEICYLALTSTGKAFYKDLIIIFLIKLFRIKRVYHLHNKGVDSRQTNFFNRIAYHFAFDKAEIILLSKNLYSDVKPFVNESNVHICPNGLADENLHYKYKYVYYEPQYITVNQNLNSSKPIQILFLSNLSKAKGVFVLLDACTILKRRGLQFVCIFIGSEGDITTLEFNEKVIQLNIEEQIKYYGKQYGLGKQKAFAESDIFVFPTYFETFGLVNLEAMQYSLPIVSTFEGGIPDIIDDNVTGFLVPQKNAIALAEKIEVLIKNPILRLEMGRAGRKKYESAFTLEKFERLFTSIMTNIIIRNNGNK